MTDGLAQKIQHPQIKIVLLDLPIANLEIVEERNDEVDEWLIMIEVDMIGICVNK